MSTDDFTPYVASESDNSESETDEIFIEPYPKRQRVLHFEDDRLFDIPDDWLIPRHYPHVIEVRRGHVWFRDPSPGIVEVDEPSEVETASTLEEEETANGQDHIHNTRLNQAIEEVFGSDETDETVPENENGLYCYVEKAFHSVSSMPICANSNCGKTQCTSCIDRWRSMGHSTCMFCRRRMKFAEAINLDLEN